ncbi:MAG: hypothetical protein Q4G07_02815 [Oscillospiraceae bacterium]|nr:hypothetical protein [Oscillospiraceae bacterium]
MDTILVMALGVIAGLTFFPKKAHKANNLFQIICTLALIFCMGVSLAAQPGFFEQLGSIGLESLLFCLLPIAFSVLIVYFVCRAVFGPKKERGEPK